jgi:anti-anti-sigma factor
MQVQYVQQAVVVLLDRNALSSEVDPAWEECRKVAGQAAGKVLELDLDRVEFVEATGLGLLVRLHKQMKDSGGRLVLRNPRPLVADVLRVTHLDRLFAIVYEPEADPCLIVPAE